MLRSKKPSTVVGIVVILGIAFLAGLQTWLKPAPARSLTISTGTSGGTYIVIGRQLARILDEYPREAIEEISAEPSNGSIENIERLINGDAHLALVMAPVLAAHPRREEIRTLMQLYSDVWQVIVRTNESIKSIEDLNGKRVYIGADGSGTKWSATKLLQAVDITESDYQRVMVNSYEDAGEKLTNGEADAAFFMSATPTDTISETLSSGCCNLLDLSDYMAQIEDKVQGVKERQIARHIYANQPDPVKTLETRALLVARKDIESHVVNELLNAVFDHVNELAVAHIRVQDIRLERTLTDLPKGFELHPAARQFRDKEREKLRIATGVINGKYYDLGKRIQLLLQKKGISSRVIHTDGSIENLNQLNRNKKNTLAIMQYDTALASMWSSIVYGREVADTLPLAIPTVEGLRRIAALHEESLHVLIRGEALPKNLPNVSQPADRPERYTLDALNNRRVCLGPENSGTQVIAKMLLMKHQITPMEEVYLSVPDMVARIGSGEIDAGFFVSHIPGEALKTIVHDDRNRLLSIDLRKISSLLGPALRASTISKRTYGAQREDEPPINTVTTRAVLVTHKDFSDDVARTITAAIFDGADFLGIEGGAKTMAKEMKSLPLHEGAKISYEKRGYAPRDWWKLRWEEVVGVAWRILAILVILIGGYQGLLRIRRDRTSNEIGRRVLAISLDPDEPNSVRQLLEIRDGEIRDRVLRRWWHAGELDKTRWRFLHELINDRIKAAKEHLTAALADSLRKVAQETCSNSTERREHLRSLEGRVWQYFQKGELDASHQAMLLEVLKEGLLEKAETLNERRNE